MDLPLRRRVASPESLEMPYKHYQENIWGWKETEVAQGQQKGSTDNNRENIR